MFAVVRTGGKQYRVAPGDKIVVERLDGNAGDQVTLGEVLLAGEGSSLKSTDGLTVAAEIVAQAKGDKVTVFKKRRRHNYRRKKGHRQLHTILRIVAIGDHKAEKPAKPAAKAEKSAPAANAKAKEAPMKESAPAAQAQETPAATAKVKAEVTSDQHESLDVTGQPTPNPAPNNQKAAGAPDATAKKAAVPKPAPKAAAKKPAAPKPAAKIPSTKNAAPAKGAPKKSPKAK